MTTPVKAVIVVERERARKPKREGNSTAATPVLTVSPMKVYLGHFFPTTPANAGPVCIPILKRARGLTRSERDELDTRTLKGTEKETEQD